MDWWSTDGHWSVTWTSTWTPTAGSLGLQNLGNGGQYRCPTGALYRCPIPAVHVIHLLRRFSTVQPLNSSYLQTYPFCHFSLLFFFLYQIDIINLKIIFLQCIRSVMKIQLISLMEIRVFLQRPYVSSCVSNLAPIPAAAQLYIGLAAPPTEPRGAHCMTVETSRITECLLTFLWTKRSFLCIKIKIPPSPYPRPD